MKVRLFGCNKFARLLYDQEDKPLRTRDISFLRRHRDVCPTCRREQATFHQSLNMLRAATIDVTPAKGFDERVIRRVRVNRVRESLGYWSPAFLGSAVACMALLVALHLLASPTMSSTHIPNGEAMRANPSFPSLELTKLPRFDR
jgi:hypothetical protein